MPVTIVIGGQYGSEGKGKLTSFLSLKDRAAAVVRCGGPNAGHTVVWRGERRVLRQVPAGFINPDSKLLIAAGAIVDPALLIREAHECGVTNRLGVDGNAAVLDAIDARTEGDLNLRSRVGSTLSGTGV